MKNVFLHILSLELVWVNWLVGISLGVIVVLIILGIIYGIYEKHIAKSIENVINSCRIFIIDLKNSDYNYFQVNRIMGSSIRFEDITKDRVLTYQGEADFYKQYDNDDSEMLKNWINALVDGEPGVSKTKDVYTYLSKTKLTCLSFLEAFYVSTTQRKIYLKSTLLKNAEISKQKMKRLKLAKIQNDASTREFVTKALIKNGYKGFTTSFKFYYIDEERKNSSISPYVMSGLFDVLREYSASSRYFLRDDLNSVFTIVDTKNITKEKIILQKVVLMRKFKQFLELNGFLGDIGIAASAVENKYYHLYPDSLFENSRILVENLAKNRSEELVFDTDATAKDLTSKDVNFKTEEIINKDILFSFDPVLHIAKKSVIEYAYFAETSLRDKFLSFSELRANCEHDNTLDKLFLTPMYKLVHAFNNEIKNAKYYNHIAYRLFAKVSFQDYEYFEKAFKRFDDNSNRGWSLVLTFTEEELSNFDMVESDIVNKLSKLTEDYSLMLILENTNEFKLNEQIMKLFDFFALDLENQEIHRDETLNFKITSKAGKATRYKKPIIIRNVSSWPDLELLVNDGIEYLAGPVIFPRPTEMIVPVDKRVCDKIANIADIDN